MDKIMSSVVVILTVLITAAAAATLVFGQTGFLTGYSGDVQNRSRCGSLGEQGKVDEYQEMNCGEIYGDIETVMRDDANNGVTKMEGIAIGSWPSNVFYDSRYEYTYEIDFSQLDGQEYLDERGSTDWGGQFEYNSDYYYTVGFKVEYPTDNGGQSNAKQWGGEVGNFCQGQEVCYFSNNFTYSETGNLSGELMPCHNTLGSQDDFNQRVFIQAYEERNNGNFEEWVGRVTVMNQSLDLLDKRGTPCWTESANPSFENGQMFLREMQVSNDFRIDQEETVNVTADLSNDQRGVENLSLLLAYPNGSTGSLGDKEILQLDRAEYCGEVCSMNASVNMQQDVNIPACASEHQGWEMEGLALFIEEEFTDDSEVSYNSPKDWQAESMMPQTEYVSNSDILDRCWPNHNPFR